MKRSILVIAAVLAATGAFAQTAQPATPAAAPAAAAPAPAAAAPAPTATTDTSTIGGADPTLIGADKANPQLKEVMINKFEDDGFWTGSMSRDDGFITLRKFESKGALAKKPIQAEKDAKIDEPDDYVLGVKVEHLHRAVTSFSVIPSRPISMPGIVKTISVWVVGRNVNHQLFAMVNDQFGNTAKIPMGSLAFTGWRQLTGAVPPSIKQLNPRYEGRTGLTLQSFVIETDPAETYGLYYMYFDDLTVWTDLFIENKRDPDDMNDSVW
jgi:hypothetical protein